MSDVKKRIIDYETAGEVNEDFYLLGDNGTEGTFKIPVKAVGPIESICPVYDAEAGTYDEGDYCFYDQKMYQCNTDISVPEDFDSTKWDEVTIAEIMASQQNQISTINQSLTKNVNTTIISGLTVLIIENLFNIIVVIGGNSSSNLTDEIILDLSSRSDITSMNIVAPLDSYDLTSRRGRIMLNEKKVKVTTTTTNYVQGMLIVPKM